jgi:hypothetical protein
MLLKKASVDPGFREELLRDPLAAAASISLDLSAQESNILKSTSKSILETMIDNTWVPKQHRSTFRTAKTAAMLAVLLCTTAVVAVGGGGVEEPFQLSPEHIDLAKQRMAEVQRALEAFRQDHGRYPTNSEWLQATSSLGDYVSTSDLYDPWKQIFHYEAVEQGDQVVNYRLESMGLDQDYPGDNIPCPIDPEEHSFD